MGLCGGDDVGDGWDILSQVVQRILSIAAYTFTSGAILYLCAGLPMLVLTEISARNVAPPLRYWVDNPWICGAIAFSFALFITSAFLDNPRTSAGWPLVSLIPTGVYLATLEIYFALSLGADFRWGTGAFGAAIDGTLWVALLSPVVARLPWAVSHRRRVRSSARPPRAAGA